MSFAQKMSQWFQRKPVAAAVSDTVYDGALNSVQGAPSILEVDDTGNVDDLISLPILGRATVAKHQRTLFTVLGGSVLVLVLLSV